MKIGILGSGDVAQALAKGFLDRGDHVMLGTRDPAEGKLDDWAASAGDKASVGTFEETAEHGEIVLLCVLGAVNDKVLQAAGDDNLAGKVLIDVTNPLDFSAGMPPRLLDLPEGSGGEQVQALAPKAKVVKCWNIVGNPSMVKPDFPGGPPTMFYCGDDEGAKKTVAGILDDFGWVHSDIGGIGMSGHLESMCIVWVAHGAATGNWDIAFKMLTN